MSIKSVINLFNKMEDMSIAEFMADEESDQIFTTFDEEMAKNCETAKNTILERLSERDFVRFVLMIQRNLGSGILMSGKKGLLIAESEGVLQPYTQTIVLAVIGALIEEEIL